MITVDSSIFELYPGLTLVGAVINNADNTKGGEFLKNELVKVSEEVAEKFGTVEPSLIPEVAAWRAAFKKFGANKDLRSSVENLLRRARGGKEIPLINPLVAIGNICSLKYRLPCGVENIDALKGALRLTRSAGNEEFQELGSDEKTTPALGEVIYCDDHGAVCRGFNWRECERVAVGEGTKNALLVFEALDASKLSDAESARTHFLHLLEQSCGGTCSKFNLNSNSPSY